MKKKKKKERERKQQNQRSQKRERKKQQKQQKQREMKRREHPLQSQYETSKVGTGERHFNSWCTKSIKDLRCQQQLAVKVK